MRRRVYVLAAITLWLSTLNCGVFKKQNKSMGGYYLANQLAKVIDTTFEYDVFSKVDGFKPLSTVLPDSLGGRNITGGIDIYAVINEQEKVVEIEVIELALLKNKKKYLNYNKQIDKEPLNNKYYQQLKNHLSHYITTVPFKQRKEASKGNHYTFCSINFSEW
jgi:hypothetical protein